MWNELKTAVLTGAALLCSPWMMADAPEGYYSKCTGKCGAELLDALCATISDHTEVGYGGLWTLYKTSDVRPNGTIWDMYSTSAYRPGTDQCGQYSVIGDCYNREHSFPKSWFDDHTPMYDDAFHIYPTDGKVNGQRGNHPFGECARGTSVAPKGDVRPLGKLGASTFPGYSGTVFEPDDQYKGDFARSYFYMAACYNDRISTWNSDMLSGDRYPAFASWAVNLLLKWHDSDPVSKKETDRNEVVYSAQHNRNPFIDHPELVDHIWGDLKDTPWKGEVIKPKIYTPANGQTIDLGLAGVGVKRSMTVNVRGVSLTEDLAVSVSGDGFSVASSRLSATAVNSVEGAPLVVSYYSSSARTAKGSLTLSANGVSVTATLTVEAVTGIPALEATEVTEASFVARWVNVDNTTAKYTLTVYDASGSIISGYPRTVPAADERYLVADLEASSNYAYELSSATAKSRRVQVTTGDIIPYIKLNHDGDVDLVALPGQPSDAEEIVLDTDNVMTLVDIKVGAPFELSMDKDTWSQSLRINPFEDHFFVRLGATEAGKYTSSIEASCPNYTAETVTAIGTVTSGVAFMEDFEKSSTFNGYGPGDYEGTAAKWYMKDANVYKDGVAYEGNGYARMGKTASSTITMVTDKQRGAGTVKFVAEAWSEKEAATMCVDYSVDGGTVWNEAGKVSVTSVDTYSDFAVAVNQAGPVRIRLRQTAGGRVCIDNISISDYTSSASVALPGFSTWQTYCRAGKLVVETELAVRELAVYSIDGSVAYMSALNPGVTEIDLAPGYYVVVADGCGRRVVVK